MSLLAGSALAPAFLAAAEKPARHLILIELKGGNDGLNTVVPYRDRLYRKLRPHLALPSDQLLRLDQRAALHPALVPLQAAWQAGQLAVVQGLGYERPNRSHFRSHDIWASASAADQHKESGWIADALAGRGAQVQALVYGNRSAVFEGQGLNYVSMQRTKHFLRAKLPASHAIGSEATAAQQHIHAVLRDTLAYQRRLQSVSGQLLRSGDSGRAFGEGKFAQQLHDASLLIQSGLAPGVISLDLRGFDTHANQHERHELLMQQLGIGLAALHQQLVEAGKWQDTLVMTWSEFGRRATENASYGTDHGTAAPQFVMGGRVRGGFHGAAPSLRDLQNDDLVHTVDFRQLYAAVLQQWWEMPELAQFEASGPRLDLIKSA